MPSVLRHRTYRRLFTAQVVALAGTGLATVALSLLAYDLAGRNASAVLGTALAIKMVAYVVIAPVAGTLAGRVPRRALLTAMDLIRAGVALALPFVTQIWQIYVMVVLLQAASAVFTPVFQATIPHVLPKEEDYTRALSLSRLAQDLETLLSPAIAAALLTVISYDWLFAGTTAGFLASAALVLSTVLPKPVPVERSGGTVAFGGRLFRRTPRLRALLALDLAVASAGAIVYVNTIVIVRDHFQHPAGAVSLALGAYGAGSMAVALALPRILATRGDRPVMLTAAFTLPPALAAVAALTAAAPGTPTWAALLAAWALIGAASSAVLTPGGRVLRRSASAADLPAAYATRFSLSHGCWLLTYPLAGWLAAGAGVPVTATVLGALSLAAALTATAAWPARDPARIAHVHPDLLPGHPHLATGGPRHTHHYVIDTHHPAWP
ncbi:MFS transporter [Streptomyces xiamenensis]|uniref:MFS transporter n=1 Tax=Streptomyces xiamenensis TaxID=408015 RepID=UPI0037D9063A